MTATWVWSNEMREIERLVNDARTHPENYPPHGDTTGAAMGACAEFTHSDDLTTAAMNHSIDLSRQNKDSVNSGDNMHRGPSGKLVWESGEPMDLAGYHTWRAENVALGFTTAEQAVRFWMQDDAPWGWGHRNAILRQETQEAGVGHTPDGPWGNYWTLDLGTK
jgi:uncharacterized protein YkwD